MPIEFNESEFPAEQPVTEPLMPLDEAKKQAFYTASLVSPSEMETVFESVMDDLVQKGYSNAYSLAKQNWANEQSESNKLIVSEIIMDPSIDKQTKLNVLNSYNTGGYISTDIKDKYIKEISMLDNSEVAIEREAQDQVIEDLQPTLQEDATQDLIDSVPFLKSLDEDYAKPISAEATSLVGNLVIGGIKGVTEYLYKAAGATVDLMKGKDVDFARYAQEFEENSRDNVLVEWANSLDPRVFARAFGVEKEFDESYVTQGFEQIGNAFVWVAEKAVEKGYAKDVESALFGIETLGWLIPGSFKAKDLFKHSKGSPIEVTASSNPKLAGDIAASTLKKDGGAKMAEGAGTTTEAVIAENTLPKYKDTPDNKVKPDINQRIAREYDELDLQKKTIVDLMFDDNIINRAERIVDAERRLNIHRNTNLYYNQANSVMNIVDTQLQGKMVFTQNADYAFTNKANVKNAVKQLQDKVNKLPDEEKGKIQIRNIKNNKLYTIEQFNKTKDRGQFQIEWEYKKNYKMLDDEMLGKGLADEEITFFGQGANFGKSLARSSAGNFIFGTGATARWYERARQAVSPKAARVRDDIMVKVNSLINNNRKLHGEIDKLVKNMEAENVDSFSRAELARNHKDLTVKELDTLVEIQDAWRRAQDTLFEVTNQGYKTQLINSGFDRAVYIKGQYKGPVREIPERFSFNVNNAPEKVLDLTSGKVVAFLGDPAKGYKVNMKGQRLVELRNKQVDIDSGIAVEYGILSRGSEVGILPRRVVNKIPGHSYKEYKSHFFVEVVPKSLEINGRQVDNIDRLNEFKEVKGTATTRFEAEQLARQIEEELGDKYVVNKPRLSREGELADTIAEYRLLEDDYKTALSRNEDIRTIKGDNVLKDPLEALNRAANRISKTAAYSQFDKAFKEAFVRDFGPVLRDGKFPSTLDNIGTQYGRKGTEAMVKDARMVWTRHTNFQNHAAGYMDRVFQNALHGLADVFEKVKLDDKLLLKGASDIARRTGNLGAYPISGFPKRLATLALITFQMPVRHLIIQPMMFYEQATIFPKTFNSTMKKAPILVMDLLSGHPLLKEHGTKLKTFLKKSELDEYTKEIKALRQMGVLQSIDQNLAVMEAFKGRTVRLDERASAPGKVIGAVSDLYEGVKQNIFNKYGFTSGELLNRVGLFLQTKERWKAANPGKDWTLPRNLNLISDEAWRQSGAMTAAGALRFQQLPLISFLTQFQAINLKGFMNLIQDNATNLTKKDRAKLMASRLLIHGVEFGVPLAGGKMLLEYLMSHEDEAVRDSADLIRRGALDLSFNQVMKLMTGESSDFSVSEGSSISATNFFADMYEQFANIARFVTGDSRAQAPNIASLDVAMRAFERLQGAIDMFKYREITDADITDYLTEVSRVTSFGNNVVKARTAMALHDIYTKQGNAKGLDLSVGEAIAQFAGFRTRREIDQWRQQELQIDIDRKISDQITEFDRQIMNALKQSEDMEMFNQILNLQINALEQSNTFSPAQMDRIIEGVLAKDRRRFDENRTDSLLNYWMNSDAKDADMREILSRFASSNDPVIKEIVKTYKGQMKPENTMEEGK